MKDKSHQRGSENYVPLCREDYDHYDRAFFQSTLSHKLAIVYFLLFLGWEHYVKVFFYGISTTVKILPSRKFSEDLLAFSDGNNCQRAFYSNTTGIINMNRRKKHMHKFGCNESE